MSPLPHRVRPEQVPRKCLCRVIRGSAVRALDLPFLFLHLSEAPVKVEGPPKQVVGSQTLSERRWE